MNNEFKETLQGQLMELEEIFASIDSMQADASSQDDSDLIDEILVDLSNAMDNIKLFIK